MRKQLTVFFLTVFFCISAYAAMPFEQRLYKGQAIPFYHDTNGEQQTYIDAVKRAGLAERMASLVNASFMLKSSVAVGFESCGQPSAFFSQQKMAIVICSEFIEMMGRAASSDRDFMMKLPREQFAKIIDGVIWGVFFHELAHAIIHVNRVSFTGREEDVADQFAVWYAVNFVDLGKNPVLMPTVWFWGRLAKSRDIPTLTDDARMRLMADEHSLDEQRVFNIACWALGTGTEAGSKTAQWAGLPSERGQRCEGEYAQVDRAMRTHFRKYFKVRPLRGSW